MTESSAAPTAGLDGDATATGRGGEAVWSVVTDRRDDKSGSGEDSKTADDGKGPSPRQPSW